MKTTYFDDDTLVIWLSDKPIVREVQQERRSLISYAVDGSVVETVIPQARQYGGLAAQDRRLGHMVLILGQVMRLRLKFAGSDLSAEATLVDLSRILRHTVSVDSGAPIHGVSTLQPSEKIARLARRAGVQFKRTHEREGRALRRDAGGYAHATQFKRLRAIAHLGLGGRFVGLDRAGAVCSGGGQTAS